LYTYSSDLGRNASETRVQIDTTTSQVTRLQENITSLTQTAATLNIAIMNLEIKAAEYASSLVDSLRNDSFIVVIFSFIPCTTDVIFTTELFKSSFSSVTRFIICTSQVSRLQENITSLTQTAATVNITIMNLEIKAAEYDKLEQIIKRVTEEKDDLNSSVVKMTSVVQGMEENITTMIISISGTSSLHLSIVLI
jgi:SMC interacting uncharacterized protein involved in chromosome segregation